MNKGEIIIYETKDGETSIDVRMEEETVWLTQEQIAILFGTKRPAITKHLNNIYKSEELDEKSTYVSVKFHTHLFVFHGQR